MASIKMKFRKSTVTGKEGVLTIQIIDKRKVKILTTRFHIFPHEWDAVSNQIICQTDDREREAYLRQTLMDVETEIWKLNQCREALKKKNHYTVEEWIERYTDSSLNGNLFPFMEHLIRKLSTDNRNRTAAIYGVASRSFYSFRKGVDLPIDTVDATLMRQYENYLKTRDVSMNTSSCYMRVWRAVYNRAVDEGLTPQRYPFRGVYTGIAKTVKRAIGETLILRLKALDLGRDTELSLTRDLFMFSFYTRGMSFIDMANLRHSHIRDGYLHYTRSKTRQKLIIRIEPCMADIVGRYSHRTVDNYLLPIFHPGNLSAASLLRTYNKRLARLSSRLQLEKPLTSYVARHSWATIALRKGVTMQIISEGMGHENEHTTRIYLAGIDQADIDQANARIIAL